MSMTVGVGRNVFRCAPKTACRGAECCKGLQVKVSAGDILRMSKLRGVAPSEFFRRFGACSLQEHPALPPDHLILVLSLVNNPCKLLSTDESCSVHDARPITCAGFPYLNFAIGTPLPDFGCLKGYRPTAEDLALGGALMQVEQVEQLLEFRTFWRGSPPIINTDISEVQAVIESALSFMQKHDPTSTSELFPRMIKALTPLSSGEVTNGQLYRSLGEFCFILLHQKIAERFDRLTPEELAAYEKNSQRYLALLKEMRAIASSCSS